MANLTYRLRGKSPANGCLDYILENGDLISTRPINFKLTVQMDPDHPNPIDGEVKLTIGQMAANFYSFTNGLDVLTVPFEDKTEDFPSEIDSKIIMAKDNTNNIPLKVYLTVQGGDGLEFPIPISKGKHEWDKCNVIVPLTRLLNNLNAMNISINDLL
tara:strand:+ start:140 stop:613 length:474 start_codon:yes stop_codon:yes gene_type:complete